MKPEVKLYHLWNCSPTYEGLFFLKNRRKIKNKKPQNTCLCMFFKIINFDNESRNEFGDLLFKKSTTSSLNLPIQSDRRQQRFVYVFRKKIISFQNEMKIWWQKIRTIWMEVGLILLPTLNVFFFLILLFWTDYQLAGLKIDMLKHLKSQNSLTETWVK